MHDHIFIRLLLVDYNQTELFFKKYTFNKYLEFPLPGPSSSAVENNFSHLTLHSHIFTNLTHFNHISVLIK